PRLSENKKLTLAFGSNMKKLINPIYLTRNEEEILRNIVILTKQLNYVKDIPQVIISFDKQTAKEISFTVILLRLLKKNSPSLKELFSYSKTLIKFSLDESKIVGVLKKKYPKEANVFRLPLNKFDFLRRDHSLDLRKARQNVFTELTNILGKFRDFNGGLLAKQLDAMQNLKKIMPPNKKSSDYLLEEFFYSIKPAVQQSIVDAKILKKLFMMFTKILKKEFKNKNIGQKEDSLSKKDLVETMTEVIKKLPKEKIIKEITVIREGGKEGEFDDEKVEISEELLSEINKRVVEKMVKNVKSEEIKYKEEKQKDDIDGNIEELENLLG
ncbi:hypothetical protein LCGC14_3072430, partial [marine sediment metagenome]